MTVTATWRVGRRRNGGLEREVNLSRRGSAPILSDITRKYFSRKKEGPGKNSSEVPAESLEALFGETIEKPATRELGQAAEAAVLAE